jgi:thymidylate synthase (FAD)
MTQPTTDNPTPLEAEQRIDVLDQGFVRLVDVMGNDARIVQAARVSYGDGTKTVREDAGLIDYLMRHKHTSPFEMVEFTFHIKAPIFVVRQWFRHRTACLSGDTVLSFDLPGAKGRGKRQHHGVSIEKFHQLWHQGATIRPEKRKPGFLERVQSDAWYTIPSLSKLVERREETLRNLVREGKLEAQRENERIRVLGRAWHEYAMRPFENRVPMRERLSRMQLRRCNETNHEIEHTRVTDIWQTGIKPVFQVTLENGYRIKMTKDHLCLTEQGWLTLSQATRLRHRADGGVTWDSAAPKMATNGEPLHQSAEWLGLERRRGASVTEIAEAAGVSYHTIRKWLKVHDLKFDATERAKLSGQSQRGQRRTVHRGPLSEAARENIRRARSGANSNFYKGGISTERERIGRWTTDQAARVHRRHGFSCVICSGKRDLEAHHADPVWHNLDRALDPSNLVSLCASCHGQVHARNLELEFLEVWREGRTLHGFLGQFSERLVLEDKPRPTPLRLARKFVSIASIEYAGEEMTYDLSVEGPHHNFVANGLIVHNSVNEISGRYSVLRDEFYLPDPSELRAQSAKNKQVGEGALPDDAAVAAARRIHDSQRESYTIYEELLELGVAREMAREVLPVGLYTEFYWKQNLHNLLHFLRLRLDWHAQTEIRVYADAVAKFVSKAVPATWASFEEHMLHGANLSGKELDAIRELISKEALKAALEAKGLAKSRVQETMDKLYPQR